MGLHMDRFKWLRKLQPQNNLLGLDLSAVCVYVCEGRGRKGGFCVRERMLWRYG